MRADETLAGSRRVCVFARLWHRGLGDLVQRNIFLYQLRHIFPRAEITQIVGHQTAARFGEFFSHHSYATRIVTCPDYGDDDSKRWDRFLAEVADERYDCCVIDPDSRNLSAEHAARCGIAIRIGFVAGRADDCYLTLPVHVARSNPGLPPDLLDLARGLADAVGLKAPTAAEVVPQFPHRPEGVPMLPAPVIAVHPGGARHWNRRWPLDSYAELCSELAETERASLVLIGSAEERPELRHLRDSVIDHMPKARVEISAGDSLNRLANLLNLADVFVSNDSAPAHIAAALGRPTVVLYGPTMQDAFMWSRAYVRHIGVGSQCECRACGVASQACDTSYIAAAGPYPQCLTRIDPADVRRAVRRQLATLSLSDGSRKVSSPRPTAS